MCQLEAALLLNLQPAMAPFDTEIMLKMTTTDVHRLFAETDSDVVLLLSAVFWCSLLFCFYRERHTH